MNNNNLLNDTLYLCENLGIDLLDKEQIQTLIDNGLIITPTNIFGLKNFKELLIIFLEIPENEVDNILKCIEISRKCTLESFLRLINIESLSDYNYYLISQKCGDFKGFKKLIKHNYDFSYLDGISESLNNDIYNRLKEIDWEDLGNKLIIERR